MNLNYKTLLEIHLLNEFFLTQEDGTSLLNEADPVKRNTLLENAFETDRETMSRDIDFDFPDSLKTIYANYGLILIPSYSGCRILIRVMKNILSDGSVVFQPFIPLPGALEIFITLTRKNNLPDVYSNTRISDAVPAVYLFSNENISGPRVFPYLVNAFSTYTAGSNYDQGEMVLDAANKLQEIYYDKDGNSAMVEIKNAVNAYANGNDRLLLPLRFVYTIRNKTPVTQATFTLKDRSSAVVKTISFSQSGPLQQVTLDFTDKAAQLQLSGNLSLPDAVFTLEASGNSGFAETRTIVFDQQLYARDCWGLIHIKPAPANADFSLLAGDGFLIRRQDAAGIWTEAPVVEIPVKSRLGNLRYLNSKGKQLDLAPTLTSFLNSESGTLISLRPVSLANYYFLVPDSGGTTTKYLPAPISFEMKKDAKQRIYFDVYVPESDLFPVVP